MTKLEGKRVLITAGPTQEAIDPVRFISNHSSGKMGIAIAEYLADLGAKVELVLGPTSIKPKVNLAINVHSIISAKEMYEKCLSLYDDMDVAILSAAVSDYTPIIRSNVKIKKKGDSLTIEMVKTKDILKELGEKKKDQILVGFALETNNELEHAKEKLHKKNLDFIVLNSLRDENAGFQYDTNKITIIDNNNKQDYFELKSKTLVAVDIVNKVEDFLN